MTPKAPNKPAELLSDLESIRALLGDDFPDEAPAGAALDPDSIPLLSDIVEPAPAVPAASASDDVPQIEAELKRRLESRIERLVRTPPPRS